MADKKQALYLVKDGEGGPKLFAAEDVEAAKANGWSEPDFPKSNGTDWNAEDDLMQQNVAAEAIEKRNELRAKKDAERAKGDEQRRAEAEKARAETQPAPDMRVQIVDPPKAEKKK